MTLGHNVVIRTSIGLGISGMACKTTGVTIRPESSIVELGELASGVAIVASVSEISDSRCHSDLRSVKASI